MHSGRLQAVGVQEICIATDWWHDMCSINPLLLQLQPESYNSSNHDSWSMRLGPSVTPYTSAFHSYPDISIVHLRSTANEHKDMISVSHPLTVFTHAEWCWLRGMLLPGPK